MESGNKKKQKKQKKIIIMSAICFIVVIGCVMMLLPQDKESMHNTNVVFFEHFLARSEEGDIRVISLERYVKEGYHYYDVVFEEYDYDIEALNEFHLVYFGNFEDIDGYFCPEWKDKGDLLGKYNAYLEALKSGEEYTFTREETEKYMREYYEAK